jgi:hypothetical protein
MAKRGVLVPAVPTEEERAVALNPWFRALTLLALPVQLARRCGTG